MKNKNIVNTHIAKMAAGKDCLICNSKYDGDFASVLVMTELQGKVWGKN